MYRRLRAPLLHLRWQREFRGRGTSWRHVTSRRNLKLQKGVVSVLFLNLNLWCLDCSFVYIVIIRFLIWMTDVIFTFIYLYIGLGKRPLVWDQESGSNPVVSWRIHPYSLVFGLAASRTKSPRWFESTWAGFWDCARHSMFIWFDVWFDCVVLGLAQYSDMIMIYVRLWIDVNFDNDNNRLVNIYIYILWWGKVHWALYSFGDT